MPHLLLIRHAESLNNQLHHELIEKHGKDLAAFNEDFERLATRDPGLSETGKEQAERVATYLRSGVCQVMVRDRA